MMRLMIASDVCTNSIRGTVTKEYCEKLYAQMKPLLDTADYRVANLEYALREETIGAPIAKGGPNLYDTPAALSAFTVPGFDAVTLANNHTGDYGAEAVLFMLEQLEKNRIAYAGAGKNIDEAYNALRIDKCGVTVSLLSVCENEFGGAQENKPGSAVYNFRRLMQAIRREKAVSDFVIVVFHGGNEYNPLPSPATTDRYRTFIDLGADAVIAMHTHCMQGYETYEGKPIVYSMGNFFFPKLDGRADINDPWNWGYLTELNIEKGKAPQLTVHPYRLENNTLLHVFEGKEKQKVMDYLDKLCSYLPDRAALTRYFDAWCTDKGAFHGRSFVHYEQAWEDDLHAADACHPRNMFWCEAHYTLLKNTLQMLYEGRFNAAKDALDELYAMQKMPF